RRDVAFQFAELGRATAQRRAILRLLLGGGGRGEQRGGQGEDNASLHGHAGSLRGGADRVGRVQNRVPARAAATSSAPVQRLARNSMKLRSGRFRSNVTSCQARCAATTAMPTW